MRPSDLADPPVTLTLDMFDGSISAYSTGFSATSRSLALGSSYKSLADEGNIFDEVDLSRYSNMSNFYLSLASDIGLFTYNKKVVMGGEFEPLSGGDNLTAVAWYSGQPYHAMPIAVSYLMNAFARQVRNSFCFQRVFFAIQLAAGCYQRYL